MVIVVRVNWLTAGDYIDLDKTAGNHMKQSGNDGSWLISAVNLLINMWMKMCGGVVTLSSGSQQCHIEFTRAQFSHRTYPGQAVK